MATIAAIAAAAIGAGTSAYQASQAGGGGGGRSPRFQQTPEPAYERALRMYTARLLAQGATTMPPSFLDFVSTGGKAKFDLGDVRMTPGEAEALKITGPGGKPIPYVDPGAHTLTVDQILYLGSLGKGSVGRTRKVAKEAADIKRLREMTTKPQTPKRQKREERIRGRLGKAGITDPGTAEE